MLVVLNPWKQASSSPREALPTSKACVTVGGATSTSGMRVHACWAYPEDAGHSDGQRVTPCHASRRRTTWWCWSRWCTARAGPFGKTPENLGIGQAGCW